MQWSHVALAFLVMAFWGFNFIAIHLGLESFPPFLFCAFRFFFASVPIIFFIKKPDIPFRMIFSYGLVTFGLQYVLLFWGIKMGMPAGLASLLYQTQVFFTIGLAAFFFKEKPSLFQILGILVGFSGIAVIALHRTGQITEIGLLLTLGAAITWAVGNILSKKAGKVNMLSLVVWGNFVSWPPVLLLSIWTEFSWTQWSAFHWSWVSVMAGLYVSYIGTVFCFSVWSDLLHRYPVSKIVPFTLSVPAFGMFFAFVLLDESLEWWKILAALLIMSGLIINLFGSRLLNLNRALK